MCPHVLLFALVACGASALATGHMKVIQKVHLSEISNYYTLGVEPEGLPKLAKSLHERYSIECATRRSTSKTVAVKIRTKGPDSKWASWLKSVGIHVPTLGQYYDVFETQEAYYVFMERVSGVDSEYLIEDHGRIERMQSMSIVKQTLQAVHALHSSGRIHRDIKLENVVADLERTPARAKLIDFDVTTPWKPSDLPMTYVLGTAGLVPPEAYRGIFAPASDVFSVGVLMYMVLTGHMPCSDTIFGGSEGIHTVGSLAMEHVRELLLNTAINYACSPLGEYPLATKLLKRMLAMDAGHRFSAARALEHPWFSGQFY